MNDNERAIESIKNIKEYWSYRPTEVEASVLAIKALEKQIPKKPIAGKFDEGMGTTEYLCPVCRGVIGYEDEDGGINILFGFCPDCGQKLSNEVPNES